MKLWMIIVIIAAWLELTITTSLLSSGSANNSPGSCGSRFSSDDYVDMILSTTKSLVPDPLDLPDTKSGVELYEGKLFGLSKLYRSGPSEVVCSPGKLKISAFLATSCLKAIYRWKYKKRFLRLSGELEVKSKELEAFMEADMYGAIGLGKVKLIKLDITKLNKVKVKATGVGPLTSLLSTITNLAIPLFRKNIEIALETQIKKAIENAL